MLMRRALKYASKHVDCEILEGFDFEELRKQIESADRDIFGEFDEDLLELEEFK